MAPPLVPALPVVISAQSAIDEGLTRDQVRQRVRSGRWIRVGKGQYLDAAMMGDPALDTYAGARVLHLARAVAAARRNPGSVIGGDSAALAHRLPLLHPPPADVTLVVGPGHWSGRRGGASMRMACLPVEHVLPHPVPLLTATRAWYEVTRAGTLADALAAGDAGMRVGLFTSADVADVIDLATPLRGGCRAELAAEHLSGQRETPLESASWAYFVGQRVSLPSMQIEVFDEGGVFVGRVDFLWEAARIIGEAGGRLKYLTGDDLYREKVREDRLRAQGYRVVRWSWADLRGPALGARGRPWLPRRRLASATR